MIFPINQKEGEFTTMGLVPFVLLPLLLVFVYLYFLSANIYETDSQFIIKQNYNENGSNIFDLGFLSPGTSTSREDALLLKKFIHSPELLQILHERLGLRNHYSSPKLDFIRRLGSSASKEDFLEFYRKIVSIIIDSDSNIVSLKVLAFSPGMAHQITNLILANSESFINRISKRLADEQVNFVRQEVERAEKNLRNAKDKILAFQNRQTLVNPESDIDSKVAVITAMQAEIIQKKATLKELKGFLREDAFQITSLLNQIVALESQVEEEMKLLTGSAEIGLNQIMVDFQNLSMDLEFSENAYKSAYTSLQTSHVDASRKLKHMVVISNSGESDEPAYPRRLYSLVTSLVVLLIVYGIGKLIVATINDHRE